MLRCQSVGGFCALCLLLASPIAASGAVKTWASAIHGDFGDPANWIGGVPGATDRTTFNAAGAYTVTFDNSPNPLVTPVLNESLLFADGTVTFTSGSDGPYTYHLTGSGSNDAYLASGTLTLGDGTNPLHLTVDDLVTVDGGATFQVNSGSVVNALALVAGSSLGGGNSTITVDGPGSALAVTNLSQIGYEQVVGRLTYRNSASGSLGEVFVGISAVAATNGTLSVESGADLATGDMQVGASASAAATGTVNIHGSGSLLTQIGGSNLTVGGAMGLGRLNIGTLASGGTLATGTGTTAVHANGTITIGEGVNTGTLNANGDVLIDGGLLLRQNALSTFNLAAGRTISIQNGGVARFVATGLGAGYTTSADASYTVAGTGSLLEATGGRFEINHGAQISVSAGGAIDGGNLLDIGTDGDGTLIVDGGGSTAMAHLGVNTWGLDSHSANVTFSNGAVGTLGGIQLANSPAPGTTAVVDVLSGAELTMWDLYVAANGGTTTSATINVQGGSVTLNNPNPAIVGHGGEGSATINVGTTASGSVLTAAGELSIQATARVDVGSGANTAALYANGGITIDGGQLNVDQGSTFSLAPGQSLSVRNGGRASLAGDYVTSSSTYTVAGASSKLEFLGGTLQVTNGAQLNVTTQGLVASANGLHVGDSRGDGTLIVDGDGATVTADGGNSYFATGGGTATLELRNNALGEFSNQIMLAHDAAGGTTTNVSVESGADLVAGGMQMTALGGAASSATLTVDGPGSTVAFNPGNPLLIGHPTDGTATINVRNGGAFVAAAGEDTILWATGTINIQGGVVDLQRFDDRGGTIAFLAGSLSYLGDLTVGPGGLLGGSLSLDNQRHLTLDGTTTVESLHKLTLDGGSLSTGALVVNGDFAFNSGTLSVTGPTGLAIGTAGPLGGVVTLRAGRTLNVSSTTTVESGGLLVLESGGTVDAGMIANYGTIVLDGVAAVLGGTELSNHGLVRGEGFVAAAVTNTAAGEIRAQSGKTLTFTAPSGTNAGTINLQGGTLEFVDSLTNSATGRILGRGMLSVGGSLTNQGHIAFSSGISDVFGDVRNDSGSAARGISISGNADVTFWNGVENVAGSLFNVSAGSSVMFFGNFSGAGITGAGNSFFEADVSPGASPAAVHFGGNLFLGAAARLEIDLGGTVLGGQFDHVNVQGAATLDGILDVSLLGGFEPDLGDSFEVVHAAGGILGRFDVATLPSLAAGLNWSVVYDDVSVLLEVVAGGLDGDFNFDGSVDAADYVVWRNGLGTTHGAGEYDVWLARFGQTAASGGAAGASPLQAPVPEPAVLVSIVIMAFVAAPFYRRP